MAVRVAEGTWSERSSSLAGRHESGDEFVAGESRRVHVRIGRAPSEGHQAGAGRLGRISSQGLQMQPLGQQTYADCGLCSPSHPQYLALLRKEELAASDAQYLGLVAKADGHPVGLRGAPLQLVDFGAGVVSKDRVEPAARCWRCRAVLRGQNGAW